MTTQSETVTRSNVLKSLRELHSESVTRTQAFYKEQRTIQQDICKILRDSPKTVPELAQATGYPTHEILWHLTAMKKYGIVSENGMCGDYPLYQKVVEK